MNTANNTATVVTLAYSCTLCGAKCTVDRDEEHALARLCECCHGLVGTEHNIARNGTIGPDAHDVIDYVGTIIRQGGRMHALALSLFTRAVMHVDAEHAARFARAMPAPTTREAALEAALRSAQYQLGELLCEIPEECTAARQHIEREVAHIGATLNEGNAGKAVRS